jgi:hypothetical protein
MKSHVGMHHGKAETHEQFAPVVEYVAVMDGHSRCVCAGKHLRKTEAHIATFTHWSGIETRAFQISEESSDARAVVPKNRNWLREFRKNAKRQVEMRRITSIQADCDMAEEAGITQFGDDCGEGGGFQIPRMTGKHERKRRSAGKRVHFLFEPLVVGVSEAMKGRNGAVLVKIRHKNDSYSQRARDIEQAPGSDSLRL